MNALKYITVIFLSFCFTSLFAQNTNALPGEDIFYQSGKIYGVIAVVLLVFGGMTFYLFRLDRKIKKLEQ